MERVREKFDRRLTQLKNERETFVAHWKDINEYLLPRRGRFITSDVNKGDKRNNKIIDGEGGQALNTLVSGMMSGVTSPARRWFRLRSPDPELMDVGDVKSWYRMVEDVRYEIFARSNLYQVLPYVYEEMAAYGTGCMIQLPDFDNVVRFQAFTVGEYCLAQDYTYSVDTLYREIPMTVEQIVTRYGIEQCSQRTKELFERGNYDHWINCIHLIEPNRDQERDPDSKLAVDMEYHSCTYEAQCEEDIFLEKTGFKTFPVYAPRWHLQMPDVYGRGPGMNALGDIKQLQDQQKKKGQAISKMVNPPMMAPSSLKNQRMSTLPGDVTFVDVTQGQAGFTPAYQVQPRLGEFLADMQDCRERIRRAFFADLFLMLAQSDRRQITATEISERREEKLLVLGPVMERINHDLLDPLINNTFDRIMDVGIMPPPPEELEGTQLQVEYMSVMAQAQKSQGILGIQETAAFVGNLASINPDAVDKFDFDQAVDEYSEMRGVPPSIIRPDEGVAAIRAQKQQLVQQQQQANVMTNAAAGAKTLADTDTAGENLLTDILGGIAR